MTLNVAPTSFAEYLGACSTRFSPGSPWVICLYRTLTREPNARSSLPRCPCSPSSCMGPESISNDRWILIPEEHGRYFGMLTETLVVVLQIAAGLMRICLGGSSVIPVRMGYLTHLGEKCNVAHNYTIRKARRYEACWKILTLGRVLMK